MSRAGLFWGGVLVLIGVILLLDGLDVFATLAINIGGVIFAILLIGLGVWLIWGIVAKPPGSQSERLVIPAEGAERAEITLNHGAGRLLIGALPALENPLENLVEGTFGGGVVSKITPAGDALRVDLRMPSQGFWFFPSFWRSGYNLDWSIKFRQALPLAIEMNTGASESHVDLTDLLVERVDIRTGASSTELALPRRAGSTRIKIRSGAASISIRVPESVAARIRVEGGLIDAQVDRARFPRIGSLYQSEGFETAENRVDLDIETGAGSVRIW